VNVAHRRTDRSVIPPIPNRTASLPIRRPQQRAATPNYRRSPADDPEPPRNRIASLTKPPRRVVLAATSHGLERSDGLTSTDQSRYAQDRAAAPALTMARISGHAPPARIRDDRLLVRRLDNARGRRGWRATLKICQFSRFERVPSVSVETDLSPIRFWQMYDCDASEQHILVQFHSGSALWMSKAAFCRPDGARPLLFDRVVFAMSARYISIHHEGRQRSLSCRRYSCESR
jgi:hypothetical protein